MFQPGEVISGHTPGMGTELIHPFGQVSRILDRLSRLQMID
jgi:hypothetical protein